MTLAKIAFSVIGIYSCFLTWGILQERVSTTSYGEGESKQQFRYFIFLNMIQSFMASIVASFYIKFTGQNLEMTDSSLLKQFLYVAFLGAIASPFGYESLKHIDYPTLVLGKSCKLVPVMLMNIILYRKKFPFYRYVVVGLITLGVSSFMLLQPKSEKKKTTEPSSLYGIILLSINLLIDGITNSTQDQIFYKYKISGQQMMFFMNLFSGFLMFCWLLNPWNQELFNALTFCKLHPNIIIDILLFSLCGALGQCFIFFTLHNFGSLFLVTITVTRKFFTVLLSVFLFNHILNIGQWFSVGFVFLGIGLEVYVKQTANKKIQKEFDKAMSEENQELEKSIDEKINRKQANGIIDKIKKDKAL
ncbi:14312_t:CDS:1 [Cetraspora pellucida]|uniref:UDP-galactose transporter homolog 1 n=1 Tax=Cetraspora pellucida TaxID=1433469 RepID=A0A9N9D323_9GLOM|nr:14312_t:CDS:1 [Cetraspora pellucida]